MPTAIVTGATGILGREIVHQLAKTPNVWTTVHALSRSQKEPYPEHVQHDKIDLLATPEDIAEQLKAQNVEAEYLFFAAYLQKGDDEEMDRINGDMLQNFLTALTLTGAEKKLKRVILTTGAKHYGVHLGPAKVPMEESDPWVEGEGRPPNFYYRQQRILGEKSRQSQEGKRGQGWDWVVTYPNDVIGVAKDNYMNLTTALGIYATITKELSAPFKFPGSVDFYTRFDSFTSARFHAVFCLWASQEQGCSNEAFNVVNGDVQSWQTLWPLLARRFGLEVPREQFKSGQHEKVLPLIERPPIADWAGSMGLADRVKRGEVQMMVDLEKWAARDDVKGAWERVAKREGLQADALEKATWFFLNFVLGRNYDVVISMDKARRFGFTGSVNSWEALSESLDGLVEAKVLPGLRA
ncbi:SDR family oxidoreductase [Aspergillus melleus]|uniref:SDR family oxidoreductase n=1 Tax=Aspergillus melleus TaxID=138277 RepID=UPI001E8E4467|nr:uncharacterized protein LDX57_002525 [Aspergillus melleus]KAH8424782.1 hypothetical protein LDX57_002525 [Aspergillus melleus]